MNPALSRHLRWLLVLAALLVVTSPAWAQDDVEEFAWPKSLKDDKGEVIVYQPQVESYEDNVVEARAAVSVQMAGQESPIFGAMWFKSFLTTDLESRTATLAKVEVTAARFPEVDQEKVDNLSRYLEADIPTWDYTLSIDRLIASLPENQGGDTGFSADPPDIYYSIVPAVLVLVDGDPILQDLEGYDLEIVANSAFFIVTDKKTGYYLRGGGMWFVSDDIGGAWIRTEDLPAEVAKVGVKVEEEEQKQAAEQAEDAQALEVEADPNEPDPLIFLSTVPAELIVTNGEPDFAPIPDTQLLYLKNTETDVVMDIASQNYFILISGRWFKSASLSENDWAFVPFEELPADFANIPEDSDMASVRPNVPGTVESQEAILESQIPQTAEVDRKTATTEVTYDGDPQFESCAEGVAYAINTESDVLLIDEQYYCVDNAVWFVAAGPSGPWAVATEVPAVIQDLPPECPVYNVKYVYIYDSTPDVVYVGYTSGYYGSYVWGPCVVYGTGYYYPYWYGYYYYPRAVTYGWGVHYNPWTGWGFHFGYSYGWVTVRVGFGYPYYPYWGRGGYRYGYRHGYWRGYNHGYRHGYRRGYAAGYRAGNRSNRPAHHNNAYRNRANGVAKTGDVRRDTGKRPSTSDNRKNNVYADRNGDVYRDKDGSWEKREDGQWKEDRSREGDRDGDRSREGDGDRKGTRDKQERDRSREDRSSQDRSQADRDRSQRDRQQADRSRDSNRNNRQQLDRDRSSRDRGAQRQRQAPNRGSGGSRRGGGGGGRRR